MTKIVKLWMRMSFWDKLRRSFSIVSAGTLIEGGVMHNIPHWVMIVVGGCGFIAELIPVWVEDKDGDGKVDQI